MKTIILFLSFISLQAQDTLTLNRQQTHNIYIGLKQGEQYKALYSKALIVVDSLVNMVEQQDYNLNQYIEQQAVYDATIKELNTKLTTAVVSEDRKKWYNSKLLWIGIGLIGGGYIESKFK